MVSNARSLGDQLGGVIFAIGLALALLACPPPPPDPPPPPPPDPNLPPPPTEGTPCERACERMAQLDCPEAEPSPKGEPCEVWLCNAVESGIVDLNPECLAGINACSEVDGRCRK